MIHLLPSSSIFDGFLVRILSGFGGFFPGGAGLLFRNDPELSLRDGTGAAARKDGFLCVIWLGSTFFSPFVTDSPLFKSSKTAPMSAAGALTLGVGGMPGGGGPGGGGIPAGGIGGGGGGIPPDDGGGAPEEAALTCFIASFASMPFLFHATPVGWNCLVYSATALKSLLKALTHSTLSDLSGLEWLDWKLGGTIASHTCP